MNLSGIAYLSRLEKPPVKKGGHASQANNNTACNGPETQNRNASTWVHEIFQGTLTNETLCLNCETVKALQQIGRPQLEIVRVDDIFSSQNLMS